MRLALALNVVVLLVAHGMYHFISGAWFCNIPKPSLWHFFVFSRIRRELSQSKPGPEQLNYPVVFFFFPLISSPSPFLR